MRKPTISQQRRAMHAREALALYGKPLLAWNRRARRSKVRLEDGSVVALRIVCGGIVRIDTLEKPTS
ncbi:MAG: hypothetical protein JW910_03830 [Anaerolineae bacterium]|nr:hypothetical protein [Anaerolineae bacterium]